MWKSTDHGKSWQPKSDFESCLAIGGVVLDPVNPSIVYAGTGEGNIAFKNMSGSIDRALPGAMGRGILKSIDAGETWSLKGQSVFDNAAFAKLAIDPLDASHLAVATTKGVFISNDAGESWKFQNILADKQQYPATSVKFHANRLYACIWGKGIFYSADASGGTWHRLTNGLPQSNISRIELDASATAPGFLVALFASSNYYQRGLYESVDSGASWKMIGNAPDVLQGQGFYNMVVKYSLAGKDTIYLGGVGDRKNHLSSLFKGVRHRDQWYFLPIGQNLHVDFHAIEFEPKASNVMYCANDGGIYRSQDYGVNWYSCNTGLAITQINSLDYSEDSLNFIIAGTQDNGTIIHDNGGWQQVDKGDGGLVYVHRDSKQVVYNQFRQFYIARSDMKGKKGTFRRVYPALNLLNTPLYSPYSVNPRNADEVVLGIDGLYITLNGGQSWERFNFDFTKATGQLFITNTCFVNNNLLYIGTSNGRVWRVHKTATSWNVMPVFSFEEKFGQAKATISMLADPSNPDVVYFSLDTSGAGRMWMVNTGLKPLGKALRMESEIQGLPAGKIYSIHVTERTHKLIAAGEFGVYSSADDGKNWTSLNYNLPKTTITDVKIFNSTIRIGTYGRGIWEARLIE